MKELNFSTILASEINEKEWKESTIKQFDVWEKRKNRHFFQKRYDTIIEYIIENSSILDVGCGDGEMLNKIINETSPKRAVGIDIRKQINNENGLNLLRADSDYLPFHDNSYDLVYCCAVIEHLFDLNKTISELKRVLSKNGILIITTPNPYYSILAQFASYFKLKYKEGFENPIHIGNLKELLRQYKFQIITAQGFLIAPFKIPFDNHLEKLLGKVVFGRTILFNQLVVAQKF